MIETQLQTKKGGAVFRLIVIALLGALLGACGANRLTVIDPASSGYHAAAIQVQTEPNSVPVPAKSAAYFQQQLTNKLKEDHFALGPGLTVRYRFIEYDEGSRAARYFGGGIGNWGEGSVTVEASFFDSTGKQLAKIQSVGKISSGIFGGSFENALEKAADGIADYAAKTFLASAGGS